MRIKKDHMRYYWNRFTDLVYQTLLRLLTATSFIMVALNLVYLIYYHYVDFNPVKVLAGGFSLCVMLHLNKSL